MTAKLSKNTKLYPIKKFSITTLQVDVELAQAGCQDGSLRLYKAFKPLIQKFARYYTVNSLFGEDAENIAWVFFYEFIQSYEGSNFKELPGLIRKVLIFKFSKLIKKQCLRNAVEFLESFTPGESRLSEVSQHAQVEIYDNLLWSIATDDILEKLSVEQREVVKRTYFLEHSQSMIAQELQCCVRSVKRYKREALKALRKQLIE